MAEDCLFCQIVSGDVPADVVRRDDRTLAFRDINPQAPTHVLVIPLDHHSNLVALGAADPALLGDLVRAAGEVADAADVAEDGYRIVVNTGPQAGQSVDHVHAHVLGGRRLGWPPG